MFYISHINTHRKMLLTWYLVKFSIMLMICYGVLLLFTSQQVYGSSVNSVGWDIAFDITFDLFSKFTFTSNNINFGFTYYVIVQLHAFVQKDVGQLRSVYKRKLENWNSSHSNFSLRTLMIAEGVVGQLRDVPCVRVRSAMQDERINSDQKNLKWKVEPEF